MFKKLVIAFILFLAISNPSVAGNKFYSDSTIRIKVKGVTCSNDLKTLADNVQALRGVIACKPGKMGPTSVFTITFNPVLVGTKEIYQAVENTAGCSDPNERPYKVKSN